MAAARETPQHGFLSSLFALAIMAGAGYASYLYGPDAGHRLAGRFTVLSGEPALATIAGYAAVFFGGLIAAGAGQRIFSFLISKGLRRTLPRPVKGWLVYLPIRLTAAWLAACGVRWMLSWTQDILGSPVLEDFAAAMPWPVLTAALVFLHAKPLARIVMRAIAWLTRPVRRYWHAVHFGQGGSAVFGGILADYDCAFTPGAVFLGTSLYDRGLQIGQKDPRGLLTAGSARSGKQRAGTLPALMFWAKTHSAVIIDCKAQHAHVTAAMQGMGNERVTEFQGKDVYVLDPFHKVNIPGIIRARFDFLDWLDDNALDYFEDVLALSGAMVPKSPGAKDPHWDDSAAEVVHGVVEYLKEQSKNALWDKPYLTDLNALMTMPEENFKLLLHDMQKQGGMAAAAATRLMKGMGERGANTEIQGIVSNVLKNTAWLRSLAMPDTLNASDFRISQLKEKPTTLYICIPTENLKIHMRLLRMFLTIIIRDCLKQKSPIPILFVMDEAYTMGPLPILEESIANIPSSNLKLWPIYQNLGQLKELYPHNWQTFIANTGAVSLMNANDTETQGIVAEMLGVQDKGTNLLQPDEIGKITAHGTTIIKRNGDVPLLIRRENYDALFEKHQYGPDPDHPGS